MSTFTESRGLAGGGGAIASLEPPRRRRASRHDQGGSQVLLASSERSEALAIALTQAGYGVQVVQDGYALLNAWTFAWLSSGRQPFAAVVVDGPLPLLSVQEVEEELRRLSACRAKWIVDPSPSELEQEWSVDDVMDQLRLRVPLSRPSQMFG